MEIKDFGKFIYRTPFFPIDTLEVFKDFGEFNDYIKFFFMKPEFREAIYISSPDFLEEIDQFLNDVPFSIRRLNKFRNSAIKYISRMCTRSTPFGIFSGFGIGTIQNSVTKISPKLNSQKVRHIRLDMGLLMSFAEYILHDTNKMRELIFYPNNSIYEINDRCRYVEFFINESGERFYNLTSFEKTEYIEKILNFSKQGKYHSDISNILVDEDITLEEARAFVDELIYAKILISEFEPVMTGKEYHVQVLEILSNKCQVQISDKETEIFFKNEYQRLQMIIEKCNIIKNSSAFSDEPYKELTMLAKEIPIHYAIKHHIQVDSSIQCDSAPVLSQELSEDIAKGVRFLTKLMPLPGKSNLVDFRNKFKEKYGEKAIKLSEALDPDIGLGYGGIDKDMLNITPLVDDLPVSAKNEDLASTLLWRNDLHSFLFTKFIDAIKLGETSIEITKKELEIFPFNLEKLPPTFNAFVSVTKTETGDNEIMFHGIGASSAACLFGRFGFTGDEIGGLLNDIAVYESECANGAIVAEINHLSETRVGNVMLRPQIRPYEITYLTKSNQPSSGQILLDDLYLCILNEKFVLLSKPLQRIVIPRLTNAHNYNKDTLPIYKFLSDLQEQNKKFDYYGNLFVDIGPIATVTEFIPRIKYEKFIYSPATWYLKVKNIQAYLDLPIAESISHILEYLKQKNVPDKFYLRQGEYDLFIDTANPFSMETLVQEVSGQSMFVLVEAIYAGKNKSICQNERGYFAHEIIMPFKQTGSNEMSATDINLNDLLDKKKNEESASRMFYPGSEWFYLKLYSGIKNGDRLIKEKLQAFVDILRKENLIRQWFFIRYSDTGFHLRIRFKLSDAAQSAILLSKFHDFFADMLDNGTISNVVIDSYERELDRYGYNLIESAEKIFQADSDLCVSVLFAGINENFDDNSRWYLCIAIIDEYLNCFEFTNKEKYLFCKEMRDKFAKEFNANKAQRRHLITKYRNAKNDIDLFFREKVLNGQSTEWFFEKLSFFSSLVSNIYIEGYKDLGYIENCNYLNSLIHMSIDRMVVSKNRVQEYVLYSFLEQHYRYAIGYNEFVMKDA